MQFVVHTFGCQMNVHDSDRMAAVLRGHGFREAAALEDADVVVFNTCSVREKAEQKLRSEIGKLVPLKAKKPDLVLVVAGCVAQQEGEALLRAIPHVDLVVGPDNVAELPALVHDHLAGAPPRARTVFDTEAPRFLAPDVRPGHAPVSAFVTTMKGCDERCSFCIVPTTRGPERYRPWQSIVDEVAGWVAAGSREIMLLGQTVDSYRDPDLPPPGDDPDATQFPELLRRIARGVPELARLRYTSPHPRHATQALAEAHAELDVLARHVHMPVQSGSNRMLRRMIRRYTRQEYVERMTRLRAHRPGLTLSTDVIVGFPGETEADFAETLSLIEEIGFTGVFGFKYSPRPGTPALKLGDDVTEAEKSDRLTRLFELSERLLRTHLGTLVGTRQAVLFEGRSKTGATFEGRTGQNEIVHVEVPEGVDLAGALVEVDVEAANKHSLRARLSPGALEALAGAPRRPAPAAKRRNLPLVLA